MSITRLKRIAGGLLAAAGFAGFAAAIVAAAESGGFPWYGAAAVLLAIAGLILAGARPRPAPPLNRNEHGQA